MATEPNEDEVIRTICCPYCDLTVETSRQESPAIFEAHNQQEHQLDENKCAECPRESMGVVRDVGGLGPPGRRMRLPMPLCRRHMKSFAASDLTAYVGPPTHVDIYTFEDEEAWLRDVFGLNKIKVFLAVAGGPANYTLVKANPADAGDDQKARSIRMV